MDGAEPLLRSQAYDRFISAVMTGALQPGDIITQRNLVTLTSMPLGAVREMIPRLEAEGLIQTVPKRGLQIPAIDLVLVREAFQIRRVLEVEAFASFCETASADDLAEMAQDHRELKSRLADGIECESAVKALDVSFHRLVVDAMGNALLSRMHAVNQVRIWMIRNGGPKGGSDRLISVLDEHLAVIYALQARNPDRARGALVAHLENARKRSLGV